MAADIAGTRGQKALNDAKAEGRRYFSLSYDIPKQYDELADKIRTEIRRYALSVHESGYLVPEENVDGVKEIVKASTLAINEQRRAKGLSDIHFPKVRVLKIDAAELPEILDWARERGTQFVKDITASFEKRIADVAAHVEKAIAEKKVEVNDKAKEIAKRKKAILRDLRKRVEDAETVFFWFATTDDIKSALKASKAALEAEFTALKEVAQIGDTALKQPHLPENASETEKALFS